MSEGVTGQRSARSEGTPIKDESRSDAYLTPIRQKRGYENTRNIDDLRLRSSEKLRLAWESIYHKFQDAHLEAQDEIYLGRRGVKGDSMRVIVDRGHLRSITKKTLEFGCFHIDEAEVIGFEKERDQQGSSKSPSPGPTPIVQRNRIEDSDLSDFLKAEAQRKHLYPSDSEEEEEEPKVFKKSKVNSKPATSTSACLGPGKCTKSLCFLCGGIGLKERGKDD